MRSPGPAFARRALPAAEHWARRCPLRPLREWSRKLDELVVLVQACSIAIRRGTAHSLGGICQTSHHPCGQLFVAISWPGETVRSVADQLAGARQLARRSRATASGFKG